MIASAASHELVVTVEDGIRIGGAGSLLADAVASLRASKRGPSVLVLGLPHRYMPHARSDAILARLGLDGAGIAASVIATLQAGRPPAGAARAEAGVLVAASATPSAS
jgi:1-deoxy-D-xylulose-5-phosphate synthase